MATKRYALKYRRRREGKTDYLRRLACLKGGTPRLVVRKTNKNVIAQIINYKPDGDVVEVAACSQQLKKLGWKLSTSNIPAAYLTGRLLGKKAWQAKIKEAVVDLGLQTAAHGGRLFAVVKGVTDAGINVKVSEDAFPASERLEGAHIKDGVKNEIEAVKSSLENE